MMKRKNSKPRNHACFLYCIVSLFALVAVGGCAQSGVTIRPQPDGGEIVNPWQSTQERKFNELEKSFQDQIARAESLDPGSKDVIKLKSEYKKIKSLWQIQQKESINELPDTFVNSVGITMKLIKPGSFMMGSNDGGSNERPFHEITITKPFYIGVYEVTDQQYGRVIGSSGLLAPKTLINWKGAMTFCERLSVNEGLNYTLPTEAQWEYACRAGTTTEYSFGNKFDKVAVLQPNNFGLYDMHCNVWEWCRDGYESDFYTKSTENDPMNTQITGFRILRGGSWNDFPKRSRSAHRRPLRSGFSFDFIGFRVVLLPD